MSTEISDIFIKSTISSGASFVEGSIQVGSQSYTEFDITNGFTLPVTISTGAELSMTYKIIVDDYPESSKVSDITTISFKINEKDFNLNSNTISLVLKMK